MSKVSAIIVGSGYNAHGLARSLNCQDINVYGFTDAKDDILRRSRLFKFRECPEPASPWGCKRKAFDHLIEKVNAENPCMNIIVFPTDETWTLELLRNKERYEAKGVRIPWRNVSAAMLCLDKDRFRQWCDTHEVASPRTVCYSDSAKWFEFRSESLRLSFPVVAKPTSKAHIPDDIGFNYYKLFENKSEFLAWARRFDTTPPLTPMIVEEFIEGPVENLVSLQGYFGANGNLSVSQYRKLVQTEGMIGCGNLVLIETVDEQLLTKTYNILSEMHYHGFFDIEYKISLLNQEPIVIEINPRPCMINYAATMMGANLPIKAIEDLTGVACTMAPRGRMRPNWIWSRHLPHFFTCLHDQNWSHATRASRAFLTAWLRPYIGRMSIDPTQTLADPMVTIDLLALYIEKGINRIRQLVNGRLSRFKGASRILRKAPQSSEGMKLTAPEGRKVA